MSSTASEQRAAGVLGDLARPAASSDAIPSFDVDREGLHAALERLRDAGFETVTLVTAIDNHPDEPRYTVVHQLASVSRTERVRLRTSVPGDDPTVATCTDLWPGAAFSERECFDMFGIRFEGHEDLRRLLMPEGYDHHPLRKDFPHEGIEPDRLYREWDARRREDWDEGR